MSREPADADEDIDRRHYPACGEGLLAGPNDAAVESARGVGCHVQDCLTHPVRAAPGSGSAADAYGRIAQMSDLANLLSERGLRQLAGERSFERGADYLAAGRVARVAQSDERIEATVEGTSAYRVELRVADGLLASSCTCPMGQSGAFCKHCVAVGLASLVPDVARDQGTAVTLDDVREHLASLPGEELVELLIEEAREDERLLGRLRLRAAAADGDSVDVAAFRDAIDRAVDTGRFVTYAEAYDYSRTLDAMVDTLERLLERGHAEAAVELVEYCCSAIEQVGGMVDDSDGHLGVAFDRLQRLHRQACERADLEPVQLAERLFERMMTSEYELFYDAIEHYAALLGAAGRRRYAELARTEWERLPALRPGDDDREDREARFLITREALEERSLRLRLSHVMERLAQQTGDVDELVAVLSRDLSMPYSFLRVAESYTDAGRDDDALEWAERGMEAFPDRPDSRLVTFLADAYGSRGDHRRAAELIWDLYADHPGLGSYCDLKRYAERAGEWTQTRDRALGLLRERVAAAQKGPRPGGYGRLPYRDATELVRIRLWEDDAEAGLREARAGGCSQSVWLKLAERLDDAHPEAALAIYREQVEPTIDRRTKADYREATGLLVRIRELMTRTGRADEFPPYLGELRASHKRKRNLMKLLDGLADG